MSTRHFCGVESQRSKLVSTLHFFNNTPPIFIQKIVFHYFKASSWFCIFLFNFLIFNIVRAHARARVKIE